MSSDAVFWSPDPAAALPEAHDGLELFAPSSVDLAQRKTLPVVVRRKVPLADDMRAPLQRFTTVIALDLAADEVFAGLLGPQREDPAAWVEPTAEQLAGVFPATTTQTLQADVRAALVLPWRNGQLSMFAAVRDMRSEPKHVALQGKGSGEPPRERQIEAASLEKSAASPALPASAGVAIVVKGGLLHGAVRASREGFVHLVFCGRNHPRPSVVRLKASAYFSVDPRAIGLGGPQPYTVWAMTRDGIGGPADLP